MPQKDERNIEAAGSYKFLRELWNLNAQTSKFP